MVSRERPHALQPPPGELATVKDLASDLFFFASKILSFIREMVLKITKIQTTFALFYLHIINKKL